jgi:hypothetical protein
MFNIKYIYELVDKISPNLDKINNSLKNTSRKIEQDANNISKNFKKIEEKAGSLGKKLMFVSVPLTLGFRKFINDASDYSESLNKVDVSFGNFSDRVKQFSETAGKNFGIDRGTALDMAAMFGDMSTGMGISQQKASELSTSLVGLAGDLASFKNMRVDEVQTALTGVFTGETESLKRLGIVMTETNLEQFAMNQGLRQKIKDLSQAEKVLLRYNYVVAMSKNSIGDFSRTSGGFANQQRILGSRFKDLSITLGVILLPYAIKFVNLLIKLVEKFQSLNPATQKFILIIGGILIVLGPILVGIGLLISSFGLLKFVFKGFFIIPLIIGFFKQFGATITMLVGLVFSLITSTTPVGVIFKILAVAVIYFGKELKATFDFLMGYITAFIDKVKSVINFFKNGNLIQNFKNLFNGGDLGNVNITKENINKNQTQIGGKLDINFNNTPKGTGIQMTPIRNNHLNIGVNSIFSGA